MRLPNSKLFLKTILGLICEFPKLNLFSQFSPLWALGISNPLGKYFWKVFHNKSCHIWMEGSHSIIFFGMEELIWFFFGMVAIYLWFSLFAIPKLVNSKIYYSILMYNQLLILVKPHNAYYFSFANKLSLHLRKLSF